MNLKESARKKVDNAIRRGTLVRPEYCEKCYKPGPEASDGRATIHAHHHRGYEFPLDVMWLCPSCHVIEDPRAAREKNGRAKLTCDQVNEIRSKYIPVGPGKGPSPFTARALAREYGVSQATVDRIVRNVNWIDEALR